jgi:polar amino acid transport system substrate-binding protein
MIKIVLFCCWFGVACVAQAEPVLLRFGLSNESPPTSFDENGQAKGIILELLEALFAQMPEYRFEFYSRPWARAQMEVQAGKLDGFCTFPSVGRKAYARFALQPMYVWDYGNLVYSATNLRAGTVARAKSFDDLRGLTLVSQDNVDWEKENVPAFIMRYPVTSPDQMMHMVFLRAAGDYLIMSAEQALYYAQQFGYTEQLRHAKVDFIPNSKVQFNLGLRQTLPDVEAIIARIDQMMQSPEFLQKRRAIVDKYKVPSIQ